MNRKARRERALAQSHLFRRYGKGRWIRPQRFENSARAQEIQEAATAAAQPAAATWSDDAPQMAGGPSMSRDSQAQLVTLARPGLAIRALNNMSYGVTTTALAEFNGLGSNDAQRLQNYIDWQLDWTAIDDSAVEARLSAAGYTTLGKSLPQLWADHVVPDPAHDVRMRPAWEIQRAAFVRATYSKRQLREVMVNFWHDHFNVTANDFSSGPVYVHYDRDVLRKSAFGNFRTMLEDVACSPSMLFYLDNVSNSRSGPNENWARELLELHTLGAGRYLGFTDPFLVPPDPEDAAYPSGYTDIDVYETASAFTGWSLKNAHWQYPTENDGTFVYRQAWHDAGPKFVLGRLLNPEQPAMKDGRDVLDRLASHPGVARFVCAKLVRRFVNDTPPPALVASAAAVFRQQWQSPNQIEHVLRHILNSSAFSNAWGQKNRRPFEAIVAAMRASGSDWTLRPAHSKSDDFLYRFGFTGHAPYDWPAPNGYPDTGLAWSGASTYATTWKMLNWLTETSDTSVPLLPILQLSRSEVASWTAPNLVDYWCRRLLGYLPDAARRQSLIAFMAQNGDPATYVITDTDTWAGTDLKRHYNQQRLRSMVSLVLMTPEFLSR